MGETLRDYRDAVGIKGGTIGGYPAESSDEYMRKEGTSMVKAAQKNATEHAEYEAGKSAYESNRKVHRKKVARKKG